MAMFKNKALYVQMVNPNTHQPAIYQATPTPEPIPEVPAWIDQAIEQEMVKVVKAVIIVLAANAALTTVSKILVNNLSPR